MQRLNNYVNGIGPPRLYEHDNCQAPRIKKAREYVSRCEPASIVEFGCGTGDICGPWGFLVHGIDANPESLAIARARYPLGNWNNDSTPHLCDVIVLCEVLEHLEDPAGLVRKWLPRAKNSVISHPLNESLNSPLSGGEHQWSISEKDFDGWFEIGGHELVEKEQFQMGAYTIIIGRGRRT